MTMIPRYDEAQVQPTGMPTPRMSMASPEGAALGNIAHSIGLVSREAQDAALDVKAKADSSAVMEAQASFNSRVIDLQTRALQRQGKDALDNKPFYEEFENLYKEHQSSLKNETQQFLFTRQTSNDPAQFQLSLERHASQQAGKVNVANASALVDTDLQKLSTMYRDPQMFDQQLKVAQAHTLDMLQMQGIPDTDPAAVNALADVKSKAYVGRIKQMMTENPSEAQHLYEVHQDEIQPHERETLKHAVSIMSEQKSGIDAAEALTPLILKGEKSYTELRGALYEQLKDKPGAFKIAEAQLRGNYLAAKEDRAEFVAGMGSKVEQAINEGIASGKPVTPKDLANFPEYQALIKNGSKEATAEASRFMTQAYREKHEVDREQHQAERERLADIREARATQRQARLEQKQAQIELESAYDDPDILINATPGQIRELAPKIGYVNAQKLLNNRRKYLKDDTALQNAKMDRDVLVNEMNDAGLKYVNSPAKAGTEDFKQTSKLKARVEQIMRYEAEKGGKPVTPERQREIIRGQLLKVHVTKLDKWIGNSDEVPQFMADPLAFEVPGASSEDVGMVVSRYRAQGVEPTFEQVQRGISALKRKGA